MLFHVHNSVIECVRSDSSQSCHFILYQYNKGKQRFKKRYELCLSELEEDYSILFIDDIEIKPFSIFCTLCLIHVVYSNQYTLYELDFPTSTARKFLSFKYEGNEEDLVLLDGPQIIPKLGSIKLTSSTMQLHSGTLLSGKRVGRLATITQSEAIYIELQNQSFTIPQHCIPKSAPILQQIAVTADEFCYCCFTSSTDVVVGVLIQSIFTQIASEHDVLRSIEKVPCLGNEAVIIQLQNSALVLHRGRVIARFAAKQVFVDDFCNSGFPQFFCTSNIESTEYTLFAVDHSVLIQSSLHSHGLKHPKTTSIANGRQLFFQGLKRKRQALENDFCTLRQQEKALVSMMRKEDYLKWMPLLEGKTGISSKKRGPKIGSVLVDSVKSGWLGNSIIVDLVGRSEMSSDHLSFWCFTLNEGCSIHTEQVIVRNNRFRCTLLIKGIDLVLKALSFFVFAISDSCNIFVGEYNLLPSNRSDLTFDLVFDEYRENSRVLHFLKQIPDACFSYATSSLKSVKIPRDLGEVLRIEHIVKEMSSDSVVLLDRINLDYTKNMIDAVREALLNELLFLKEEVNVMFIFKYNA